MRDLRQKIKRQTEILGFVLSSEESVRIADLADIFNCEELTIKRDMQELRSNGIDIHSTAKQGISIENRMLNEQVKTIIDNYVSSAVLDNSFSKASSLIVNKLSKKAIVNMTFIQRAIDNNLKIKFSYTKPDSDKQKEYLVDPIMIYESQKNWRLLANDDRLLKQFYISRIADINITQLKFRKPPKREVKHYFETSFVSWLGKEKHQVKLQLKSPWAERLKNTQIAEYQKFYKDKNGNTILELVANSLDEVASWVVSRGEGIVVLEPETLKEIVIKTAKGALANYN